MTEVLADEEFSSGVSEYKQMEEKVTKDFLQGVIKLGEILSRQKDKWKPERRWLEYIENIDKTVTTVNQFIRIYKYSIENLKGLLGANITGWEKLNLFLALPEELREKVSTAIEGEDMTADGFREVVADIKDDEVEILPEEVPLEDKRMADMVIGSSLVDEHFMAQELVKEFRKLGHDFSEECVPIAEGFVVLEKAIRYLSTDNHKKLTVSEKKFWNKIIGEQMERLTTLLKR